jgi:hypothetical protein
VFLEGSGALFTTLVFEPYWNNPGPAAGVAPAAWTQWDVDAGWFWSSNTKVCSGGTITAGAGGPPLYHLSDIQTACPGTTVLGFGFKVGSFNPSYDVEVDTDSNQSEVARLIGVVDDVAEIPRALRSGTTVKRLTTSYVIGDDVG